MTQIALRELGHPIQIDATPRRQAISVLFVVILIGLHAALGVAGRTYSSLATIHGLLTLAVALHYASRRDTDRTAMMVCYIGGAEVFWRMCRASLFWEYGKYAVVLVLLTFIVRNRTFRMPAPVGVYFVLLLPSSILTVMALGLSGARDQISFNLSGPLALAVACWFFTNLRLTSAQLLRYFIAFAIPIAAVASIAASSTYSAEIVFGMYSNFATSGGFGPNQVSALLGLGALFCLLIVFAARGERVWLHLLFAALMLVFASQSALTFSRGGLYQAAGAAFVALLYFIRTPAGRVQLVIVSIVLITAARFVIVPALDSFTGGTLEQRFASWSFSGRDRIALAQIEIFRTNPWLGVGPGLASAALFEAQGMYAASHAESTRMLAEHGIPGAVSLVALFILAWRGFRRKRSSFAKGAAGAVLMWAFLMMNINGMRIVAAPLLFGLAMAEIVVSSQAGDRRVRA